MLSLNLSIKSAILSLMVYNLYLIVI